METNPVDFLTCLPTHIGGRTGNRTPVTEVTVRRNNRYTIRPEKDATYTESPTANYRMNTMDANPLSMAEKGNELLVVLFQLTDYLTANTVIILAICRKASKAIF